MFQRVIPPLCVLKKIVHLNHKINRRLDKLIYIYCIAIARDKAFLQLCKSERGIKHKSNM